LDEFSLEIYFNFNFYLFKLKFLFTISPDSKLIITKTKIIIYCELYSIQHVPTMCMGLKPLAAADRCSFFHPQGWACLALTGWRHCEPLEKALHCAAALLVEADFGCCRLWHIYFFEISTYSKLELLTSY
jgi:hypothetical protein